MVLVRPVAVGVSTMGLPLNWRQRLFMGWLAPRGSSPQLLHPCSQSGWNRRVLGAGRLQGLVFLTILMTVGLQGLSAQPLANALGLTQEDPEPSVKTPPEAGQVLLDSGQQ